MEKQDVAELTAKAFPENLHEYLHLPNVRFYHWCEAQYGLNKGIFNTIDDWFYEHGIENILFRRAYLIAFLELASAQSAKEERKLVRFGSGGLSAKLHEFLKGQRRERVSGI